MIWLELAILTAGCSHSCRESGYILPFWARSYRLVRVLIGRVNNRCKVIQTTTIIKNVRRKSYWLLTRRLDQ